MNINPQCIRKKVDYELINQAQDLIKEQKNLLKKKSEIFSLVGNETRLSIVYLLSHLQIAINNPQFKLNQIQKKPFEIV